MFALIVLYCIFLLEPIKKELSLTTFMRINLEQEMSSLPVSH